MPGKLEAARDVANEVQATGRAEFEDYQQRREVPESASISTYAAFAGSLGGDSGLAAEGELKRVDEKTPAIWDEPAAVDTGRVFVVRLWNEELTTVSDYRGTVRDVMTGAFRGFRDWSDLVPFMVAGVEKRDSQSAAARRRV